MIELNKSEILQTSGAGCCNIRLYCQSPYTNKVTSDQVDTRAYCQYALVSARNYMCAYCEGACSVTMVSNTCGGSSPTPDTPSLPEPGNSSSIINDSNKIVAVGLAAGVTASALMWASCLICRC